MAVPTIKNNNVQIGHPDYLDAQNLEPLVQVAIDKLNDRGAFEKLEGSIEIRITDGGESNTRYIPISSGHSTALIPTQPWLELGAKLFGVVNGIKSQGYQLVQNGANQEQAIFFILAHELHHIGEQERMARCHVTANQSKTYFASGVNPRLPRNVIELLKKAADTYHGYSRTPQKFMHPLSVEAVRAHDIAVEMCADLKAVLWLKAANLWTPAFENALVASRQADEMNNPPTLYQTGSLMNGAIMNCQTSDEVVEQTMTRCVALLANAPNIDPSIQSAAQKIAPQVKLGPVGPDMKGNFRERVKSLFGLS